MLFESDFFIHEILEYFRFRAGIHYYDYQSFDNLKLINMNFYNYINSQNNWAHDIFSRELNRYNGPDQLKLNINICVIFAVKLL